MAEKWVKEMPRRKTKSRYRGAQYFTYRGKVYSIVQVPESTTFFLEWEPGGINTLETRIDDSCPLCGKKVHYRGCRIPGHFKGGGIGHGKAFLKSRMKRSVRVARLIALETKVYDFRGFEIQPSLDEERIDVFQVPGWAQS